MQTQVLLDWLTGELHKLTITIDNGSPNEAHTEVNALIKALSTIRE